MIMDRQEGVITKLAYKTLHVWCETRSLSSLNIFKSTYTKTYIHTLYYHLYKSAISNYPSIYPKVIQSHLQFVQVFEKVNFIFSCNYYFLFCCHLMYN